MSDDYFNRVYDKALADGMDENAAEYFALGACLLRQQAYEVWADPDRQRPSGEG